MVNEKLGLLFSVVTEHYPITLFAIAIFTVISYIIYSWLWARSGKRIAIPVSMLFMLSVMGIFASTIIVSGS